MSEHGDPLDAVILAFLDHLEGSAARPTLHHLSGPDRLRAEEVMAGMVAARGLHRAATRPSIESLLSDTPLAGLLPGLPLAGIGGVDLVAVRRTLGDVDARASVEVDAATATVVYSYLDLRARFLLVAGTEPEITHAVRARVEALFIGDPDTSRIGVVAAGGDELLTQVLAADDVGVTITTPRGEAHLRWDPWLPLALAAARILEQNAPQWPAFDFEDGHHEALDVTSIATDIARQVIEREAARSYRGEKRRAYQALLGREDIFAGLVVRVSSHGADVDLDAEALDILRAAA